MQNGTITLTKAQFLPIGPGGANRYEPEFRKTMAGCTRKQRIMKLAAQCQSLPSGTHRHIVEKQIVRWPAQMARQCLMQRWRITGPGMGQEIG